MPQFREISWLPSVEVRKSILKSTTKRLRSVHWRSAKWKRTNYEQTMSIFSTSVDRTSAKHRYIARIWFDDNSAPLFCWVSTRSFRLNKMQGCAGPIKDWDEAETDFTKRGRRLHAEISNQISEIGVPIGSSPRMFKMLIPIAVMSISTFRECGTHEASERMKTLQQVHMFPTLQVYHIYMPTSTCTSLRICPFLGAYLCLVPLVQK